MKDAVLVEEPNVHFCPFVLVASKQPSPVHNGLFGLVFIAEYDLCAVESNCISTLFCERLLP